MKIIPRHTYGSLTALPEAEKNHVESPGPSDWFGIARRICHQGRKCGKSFQFDMPPLTSAQAVNILTEVRGHE